MFEIIGVIAILIVLLLITAGVITVFVAQNAFVGAPSVRLTVSAIVIVATLWVLFFKYSGLTIGVNTVL